MICGDDRLGRLEVVVVDLAATRVMGVAGFRILGIGAEQLAARSRLTNQPLHGRVADITGFTSRFPTSVVPEQKEGPCFAS